jgi:glycerate dehydrogenase
VLDGHVLNPGDNSWSPLQALGRLTVFERTSPAELIDRARDALIVLTNKTPIDGACLAQLPKLRGVCVLATGVNVVDVVAARTRGIPVCNVPSYGTESVAQHVFALLLELCHHVGLHDRAVHAGEWSQSPDFAFWKRPLLELDGKILGIVGYGQIGSRVAHIGSAFGMQVWATRPRPRPGLDVDAPTWKTTAEIFAGADVVSLHCPLTAATDKLVGTAALASMKPEALLINTARGGLVDEPALRAALEQRQLAGAALDVLAAEPMRPDCPLRSAPNCVITPHVAWTSLRARRRLMTVTAENVRALLAGSPINVVNP